MYSLPSSQSAIVLKIHIIINLLSLFKLTNSLSLNTKAKKVLNMHLPVCRWREWCGLPVINTWGELQGVMPNATVAEYAALFEHPGDLDLWSAGISETPVLGECTPAFSKPNRSASC